MAKALFYQPSAGISGDMNLAALLDLGASEAMVREGLSQLGIDDAFELRIEPASKMGVHGTRVQVEAAEQHHHRKHSTIVQMIQSAGLPRGAERIALDVFAAIAKAEAKIHNIDVESVHFHEVGAIDSIVDIVGGALALDNLVATEGIDAVLCNPIEVGSGTVRCAHGVLPVPAPATQELLEGLPCSYGGVSGESTTPTGAGILRAVVTQAPPAGALAPVRTGYGIGHKDFEIANVLRLAIVETGEANTDGGSHYRLETNIDDMTAEAFEPLADALFDAGADDVWFTPIVMKKSRPGITLSVLASAKRKQALSDLILNRSSSIGLRAIKVDKRALPREQLTVATSLGEVGVKRVRQPDGLKRWKVEHDDVAAIAVAQQQDYNRVRRQIEAEVRQTLGS